MKAYILSIAGAVLLSAVITVLAPNGKMGKFVKGTMKLLILIVILSPLARFLSGGSFSLSSGTIGTDSGYLLQCAAMLEKEDGIAIKNDLYQEFGVVAEVTTERAEESGFPLKSVSVKITDFGIIGQDEHIDIMNKIADALSEKYGCRAVVT
ncbi:MAG: stage III sporulation protein AF [Candidatus Gallimonas sp.]